MLVLLVGAMAAGAVYEAVASTQDAVRYPPPGRMVDVGGYQLHVMCMGQGTPTVLLDAWSGGWSAEWEPVQPLVAARTRVCAWDRAGSGWSDLGPHEHTPLAYTTELESLLQRAQIDGPYVLVAASYAGRVARLYTSRNPDQVLGVVFVDAVHEDAFSADEIADRERERPYWAAGNWVLSRLGVARLLGPELVPLIQGPVGEKVPASTRELIAVLATRPKNLEGNARLDTHHQVNDPELRTAGSLGDRPVVVLSSSEVLASRPRWAAAQDRLAGLSTNSVHLVADGPHLIAWEHPELVAAAIDHVLGAVSNPAGADAPHGGASDG